VTPTPPDTSELLARAAADPDARQALLARHRDRLRRMVDVHLDRRVARRADPSDVVQEALADAAARLSDYLRDRPLPFYPWLRRLAWERLVKLHRRHRAGRRAVGREEDLALPDESAWALGSRFLAAGGPGTEAVRRELRDRVRAALAALPDTDREVLVVRFLEQLPTADAAEVLGVTVGAVKVRQMRALARLRELLGGESEGGRP
jgi:RNA polymerase sigma-70 factor (ECF subfamily)